MVYDLSAVPEQGEAIPAGDHPFIGAIRRKGGKIHATLRVALGLSAAPEQPDTPWILAEASGIVTLPARRIGEPQ